MKIAIWYHTRLFDGEPPINPDVSVPLMMEQMETITKCGLLDSAADLVVCVNGGNDNKAGARSLAPSKARFIDNGSGAKSLLPTVGRLREWCQRHPDWLICFFHIKGVTHPEDATYLTWRRCMEKHVLLRWRQCVRDMETGLDTVGAHWLTKEKYGPCVTFPFWGGMFFWARSNFLAELPPLPETPQCRNDWFLSENWIGMGRTPKLKDYADHWPGLNSCRR